MKFIILWIICKNDSEDTECSSNMFLDALETSKSLFAIVAINMFTFVY